MEVFKIKKSTLYLAGIIMIVFVGIYFVRGSFVKDNGVNVNWKANGGIREVTLSFKNGNYYPNTVNVEVNKPVRIYLDNSVKGCYRSFTVRSFGVSKYLPTSEDYVEFVPDREGTFGFACSMGMGTGKLIVVSGDGE